MERTVAVKKLAALLGKKLGYRFDPSAPSAEERSEAREKHKEAIAARTTANELMEARRKAILGADFEYQRLVADYKAKCEEADRLQGIIFRHRVTVGTTDNIAGFRMFSVKAEGDSWEEVIAKLQEKKAA